MLGKIWKHTKRAGKFGWNQTKRIGGLVGKVGLDTVNLTTLGGAGYVANKIADSLPESDIKRKIDSMRGKPVSVKGYNYSPNAPYRIVDRASRFA